MGPSKEYFSSPRTQSFITIARGIITKCYLQDLQNLHKIMPTGQNFEKNLTTNITNIFYRYCCTIENMINNYGVELELIIDICTGSYHPFISSIKVLDINKNIVIKFEGKKVVRRVTDTVFSLLVEGDVREQDYFATLFLLLSINMHNF